MFKTKPITISTIVITALFMPFFANAQEVRDIVFPVDGEYHYSDTWGAARSSGRTHIGTDIMTDKMTPLVATADGYIEYITEVEKGWGYALYIKDSDGYSYRYLHINNDTPGTDDGKGGYNNAFATGIKRGAKVQAGQVVAYAGDSGNAESAGSHLHFEIWAPNGSPFNPYESLIAAESDSTAPIDQVKGVSSSFQFSRDLELEDTGLEVKELQKYLNTAGYVVATSGEGSVGNETEYFGPATKSALIKFQQANNITPAVGFFGPVTRNLINGNSIVKEDSDSGVQVGWLVKSLRYAEVFYVDSNLELHWIINEATAVKHFGSTWYLDIKEYESVSELNLKFGDNLE